METNETTPAPNAHLTTPTRLTGAEILWATLVGEGVTDVFGYPGGAILPAYDALRKFPIHHVLVRHEQGAAHMADGYARASGKVGVAIATSGPGATNLVTGIATAMLDSIPMVCITGNVSSKVLGTDAFQEVDITGITLPVTKHNFLVSNAPKTSPPALRLRLPDRQLRPPRPGARRHHQRRAASHGHLRLRSRKARAPIARIPCCMSKTPVSRRLPSSSATPSAPSFSPATASSESGAMEQVRTLAERAQIPVASRCSASAAFPLRIRSTSA